MFAKERVVGHMRWSGIMVGIMAVITGIQFLLFLFLPSFAQHTYVPVSRFLSGLLGMAFGMVSFSAAEIILGLLLLSYLVYFIIGIVSAVKTGLFWGLCRWIYDVVLALACIAFLFFILWGGNYLAESLDLRLGMEVKDRPEGALEATAWALLNEIKETSPLIPRTEDGLAYGIDFAALSAETTETMKALLLRYPDLFGNAFIAQPKPVLLSYPMGFTGITGIYIPLTGEANVNTYVTDAFMPATMAHEMAHRLGCAREADANFLAYLACRDSDSVLVRYSGAMLAFNYCRSAIIDASVQQSLWEALPENAKKDYHHNSEVHRLFAGPIMEASSAINDGYIRAMGQSEGLRSYGRVVDLLIAHYVMENGEYEVE